MRILMLVVLLIGCTLVTPAFASILWIPDTMFNHPRSYPFRVNAERNPSGNDNDNICSIVGALSAAPPHMICFTANYNNNITCHYSCSCRSGFLPGANLSIGCVADCAGYSQAASLSCPVGQTITYCPGDKNYGKCTPIPCSTGVSCSYNQYCQTPGVVSNPTCPQFCSKCGNCPTPLTCAEGCKAYSTTTDCTHICVECKTVESQCFKPSGSGWSTSPLSCNFGNTILSVAQSKLEKAIDNCNNTYNRCCLIPIPEKNPSGKPYWEERGYDSAVPNLDISIIPTEYTVLVPESPGYKISSKKFSSCEHTYVHDFEIFPPQCTHPSGSGWKTVNPPCSPAAATLNTAKPQNESFFDNCSTTYYRCCFVNKSNLDSTNPDYYWRENGYDNSIADLMVTTVPQYYTSTVHPRDDYYLNTYAFSSCERGFSRTCKAFDAATGWTPNPTAPGIPSSVPTPSADNGLTTITQSLSNDCGQNYSRLCISLLAGSSYSEAVSPCVLPPANWLTYPPTNCHATLNTKEYCGRTWYQCSQALVPPSASANSCYYDNETSLDNYVSCSRTFERLCKQFNPAYGWKEASTISGCAPSRLRSYDDNCGKTFSCCKLD